MKIKILKALEVLLIVIMSLTLVWNVAGLFPILGIPVGLITGYISGRIVAEIIAKD